MFLPAWAVDGSKVPASMARRVVWATSSGASGIVNAGDLRVVALPTPGGAVRIMPGTAIIENTYPNVTGQSYVVANDAAFDLPVPATGSGSGATRYVIVRVNDPEFGGQVPSSPLTAAYCEPTLVSSVSGLNYPFVVLAKIVQPASTATITQGLITEQREVANPRSERYLRTVAIPSSGTEKLTATGVDGEYWPNEGGMQYIDIPEWATQAQIRVDFGSVLQPPGSAYGWHWLEFGPYVNQHNRKYTTVRARWDAPNATGHTRVNFLLADTVSVHSSIRGTNQFFGVKGRIEGGTSATYPVLDRASNIVMDITFNEVPV